MYYAFLRKHSIIVYQCSVICCPLSSFVYTFKNIFSSETTGPIEVRFYMEHLCLTGTKVYIIGPGHMTKMAAMPIYGKTLKIKNFLSRTINQMTLKLGTQQKGLEPYKSFINNDPRLTLTYFTTQSALYI